MAVLFKASAVEISAADAVPEAFCWAIRAVVDLISASVERQSRVTHTSFFAALPFEIGLVVHL